MLRHCTTVEHTAKALRRAGYTTVLYDNLSAGHREAALGAPLIEGDISDVNAVRRAIRESGAHAVMHFAAWLAVSDSVRDPIGYYRNNVLGTLATLEAMAAEECRLFVFSSTCATYGEPVTTPIAESHPNAPINAYGQTKLAIEHALPHYERAYGLRSIRLRYFNAAGADPDGELGEDHSPEIHVIPRALEAISGGEPLQIMGEEAGWKYMDALHQNIAQYIHSGSAPCVQAAKGERLIGIGLDMQRARQPDRAPKRRRTTIRPRGSRRW